MNALSIRYKCRRCGINILFQRMAVTPEETRDQLADWNCWLQKIADGADPTFKVTTTHVCGDGRGGLADLVGIEATVATRTMPQMNDAELVVANRCTASF